jgi:dTDP-glucose 4,6-dehydratase
MLKHTDWNFVALDSFRHDGTSARMRSVFEECPESRSRVKVLSHDLINSIDKITKDQIGHIDVIINAASMASVDESIINPRYFINNNIQISLTMLEYARQLEDLKMFIQVSTDEVYGSISENNAHVEWDTQIPSNPYSASKSSQESISMAYWRTYGVPVVITNTMNMFGERQDNKAFIPRIINSLNLNKLIQVHAKKDKDNWIPGVRSYLHASNQGDALKFIINNVTPKAYSYNTDRPDKFNIAGNFEVSNSDLVLMIANIMGIKNKKVFEYLDSNIARPGHDLRYSIDGSKLNSIGWEAPIDFESSLNRLVKWSIDNKEWLATLDIKW